jgi:ABC-type glycerol-3-phosphate transport system substrate-binding protein
VKPRTSHKLATVIALAAASTLVLTGCSSTSGGNDTGEPSGEITVLTNRTDIVDTVFQDYVAQFQETYPDVMVTFEAITDYEGDTRIRLNSSDYGDVLLIPSSNLGKDQFSQFFEPLGTSDDLAEKYRFINEGSYEGNVYGLSTFGSAMGYVFNRDVWAEAGITAPPETEAEYLAALEAIKATGATPTYTNYQDGWPLAALVGNMGTITGPAARIDMAQSDAPWTAGSDIYAIDSLLYDTVAAGLSEADPVTTNWEESKNLLASGEVGSMILGSWAIAQMQDAAEQAGKPRDTIGFWPMPWQADGAFTSVTASDKLLAVSANSDNKNAAQAWVTWFIDESGFAASQGAISPVISDPAPDTLADFADLGVEFLELDADPAGDESLLQDIANESEITVLGEAYRQQLIDVARGAQTGSKDAFFADLNERWAEARATVG